MLLIEQCKVEYSGKKNVVTYITFVQSDELCDLDHFKIALLRSPFKIAPTYRNTTPKIIIIY